MDTKNFSLPHDMLQERAQHRVKLGLILGELVKMHGLHPKPEQVRAVVEDLAQAYENPAEVVSWHYAAPERLREAESAALEDNVVTWVLEKAVVTGKPMPLDELMGRS
jgi:trigger factor